MKDFLEKKIENINNIMKNNIMKSNAKKYSINQQLINQSEIITTFKREFKDVELEIFQQDLIAQLENLASHTCSDQTKAIFLDTLTYISIIIGKTNKIARLENERDAEQTRLAKCAEFTKDREQFEREQKAKQEIKIDGDWVQKEVLKEINKQSDDKNEIIDNCLRLCKSWTRNKCDRPYLLPPDLIDNIQYQLEILKSLDTKTV